MHSQALTPLTIGRNRAAATVLGALWGFGHSTGQLILGLALILLKVSRALESVWSGAEKQHFSSSGTRLHEKVGPMSALGFFVSCHGLGFPGQGLRLSVKGLGFLVAF
jgi:hypothetical protein